VVYLVNVWIALEPNPESIRRIDVPGEKKKCHSLSEAKRYADSRISELNTQGIVIEVRESKGPIRYRVERDREGNVRQTPIV
jgi:hypothetical protein